MSAQLDFRLDGVLNGALVRVRAAGTVDPRAGNIEFTRSEEELGSPESDLPVTTALGPLLLLACDFAGGDALGEWTRWLFGLDSVPVVFDTRSTIYDEDGREVGTLVVASKISLDGKGRVTLTARIIEGRVRLLLEEKLMRQGVPSPAVILHGGVGSALSVLTSVVEFETGHGAAYRMVSTSAFEPGALLEEDARVGVLSVDVSQVGETTRICVRRTNS